MYSHISTQVISLVVLVKATNFFGFAALVRKLVHLPNFLSLVLLLVLTLVGYFVILVLHKQTALEKVLNVAFIIKAIFTVILIGILNFTELKRMTGQSYFFHILCKATLCLFVLDNAFICLVGTIQFAFKVNGLDRVHHLFTSEFNILFSVLRRFTVVVFYYRITNFFWQKIFMDRNNLLSHGQEFKEKDSTLFIQRRGSYQALP
jgi:hypothetical protein